MPDVIIADMSCTSRICGSLVQELWPSDPPVVLSLPVTGFSQAHVDWVRKFKASNGGRFIAPFIKSHKVGQYNRVALIGFSAGCWGVGEILKDEADDVDFVYACDGLHGRRVGDGIDPGSHWVDFARRAAKGGAGFVDSYSAIHPPYAGTRETAMALMEAVGGTWSAGWKGTGAVVPQESTMQGGCHLIGAWPQGTAGNDAAAHIYQANKVQEAVWATILAPRWQSGQEYRLQMETSPLVAGGLLAGLGVLAWDWWRNG